MEKEITGRFIGEGVQISEEEFKKQVVKTEPEKKPQKYSGPIAIDRLPNGGNVGK